MSKKTKKYRNKPRNSGSIENSKTTRLIVLTLLGIIGFGSVIVKLIIVQVFQHEKFSVVGTRHLKNKQELPAKRGTIFDRNGEKLAIEIIHYSLAVRPNEMINQSHTIRKLSEVTGFAISQIRNKIKNDQSFAYLAHRLRPQTAHEIEKLKLNGIVLERKSSRYYPYGEHAGQIIGYCDYFNDARAGVESVYDSYLRGVPGYALFIRDNKGNRIPDLNYPVIQPIDGNDVVTTINVVYQNILEDELKKTVSQHQAVNGAAILLNVISGEVLALANYPGFDPNTYHKFPVRNYRNIAISDQFEPGSTFKIVALALMLEQLKFNLKTERIFCENGKYKIYGQNLRDHKKFGNLTLQEVIENSSNIGMAKLASKFQAPLFYRYARDFGFGTFTGIDLPAEASGILHKPTDYQKTSIPYMSIGYEVAVTPLQIACAYAAVANGGKLLKPYIVKKVVDKDGNVLLRNKPRVTRQVINPAISRKMSLTLEGVVENGTGRSAAVKGLAIAGKTGTARKIEADKNGKNRYVSKYISSFAGFFPVDSPQYALVILINEPKDEYYGSQVAAPAFSNISKRIIGIPFENELHLTEKAGLIDKITSLW